MEARMNQISSEESGISDSVKVNGVMESATLTSRGQLLWRGRSMTIEKDVIGFTVEDLKIKIKVVLDSGNYDGSKEALATKTFVLEPLSEDALTLWTRSLQHCMDSLGRPKRLLIFVNPYGGKKSACVIFVNDVKPLLDDANIEYTVKETKYQGHAKHVAHTLDLSTYDGIVCVSGDGVLVEVINGLLERDDWDTARRMPIGIIPGGTSNGTAKSLLDSVGQPCSASRATLAIIRGHKCSVDVATVSQGEIRYFSLLMLAWGLVADIDIESERYRWMGSARNDVYALHRIIRLRKYNGQISFVPAPGYEAYGEPANQEDQFTIEIDSIQKSDEGCKNVQQLRYQDPAVDMKKLNWRKINGPFISIWLLNVPWAGEDHKAAPGAKFSDGYLDLVMIKDCPRLSLLSLMIALSNGAHVKSPHVFYIKVKALILEPGPLANDSGREGIIDVDGEVVARGKGAYKSDHKAPMAYGKLQIKVDQGLATLFSPI